MYYCYFLGFPREEKGLEKCTCTYLCSMGIFYGSHSMHYNYCLLNVSLYAMIIYTRPRKICCLYIHNNIFSSFNIQKVIFIIMYTFCIYQYGVTLFIQSYNVELKQSLVVEKIVYLCHYFLLNNAL
jgi:hypothetical protein